MEELLNIEFGSRKGFSFSRLEVQGARSSSSLHISKSLLSSSAIGKHLCENPRCQSVGGKETPRKQSAHLRVTGFIA